jgi:hypothetical protein
MHGWLFKSVLFVALLALPAWAQRGGMAGGGAHGGGVSGGGHPSGGGHAFAASHPSGFTGGVRGGFGGGPTFSHVSTWNGNRSWNGWHGNGWNNWRGNNWRGRGWGWPYGYGWAYPYWGYYPGWGWYGDGWYDSGYDDSENQQAYAPSYPTEMYMAPDGTLQYAPPSQTQQQINQLQGEVTQLRAQQQQPPSKPISPKYTEVNYDTILVYRDGHTENVENYAISGKTLWIFNEARARKIPLSTLDLTATKRDNEDRGVDFNIPADTH